MKALENETAQLENKLRKAKADHDSYVKAKTTINRSKTKAIEDQLLTERPSRYINTNGTENWMFLNKDTAMLEKN